MTWQHLTAKIQAVKSLTKSDSKFPDYIHTLAHFTLCSCSLDQMINPKSVPINKPKMSPKMQIAKPEEHSSRYSHAIYLIKSKPDTLHSSYRMSWPSSYLPWPQGSTQPPQLKVAECLDEHLADPRLVPSFPVDEWMSVNELPCLCTLHFWVVSEGLFT